MTGVLERSAISFFYSTIVAELQEKLHAIGFNGADLCPLIQSYIGHFIHRVETDIQKNVILGLASFHLLKELFQLLQVRIYCCKKVHLKYPFYNPHSHPSGFYWGHQCLWTLNSAYSMRQVSSI